MAQAMFAFLGGGNILAILARGPTTILVNIGNMGGHNCHFRRGVNDKGEGALARGYKDPGCITAKNGP